MMGGCTNCRMKGSKQAQQCVRPAAAVASAAAFDLHEQLAKWSVLTAAQKKGSYLSEKGPG